MRSPRRQGWFGRRVSSESPGAGLGGRGFHEHLGDVHDAVCGHHSDSDVPERGVDEVLEMGGRGDEGGVQARLRRPLPDVLAQLPPIPGDAGRKPRVPYPSGGGHGGGPAAGFAGEIGPHLKKAHTLTGTEAVDVGYERRFVACSLSRSGGPRARQQGWRRSRPGFGPVGDQGRRSRYERGNGGEQGGRPACLPLDVHPPPPGVAEMPTIGWLSRMLPVEP